jgi:hypothetical protein
MWGNYKQSSAVQVDLLKVLQIAAAIQRYNTFLQPGRLIKKPLSHIPAALTSTNLLFTYPFTLILSVHLRLWLLLLISPLSPEITSFHPFNN